MRFGPQSSDIVCVMCGLALMDRNLCKVIQQALEPSRNLKLCFLPASIPCTLALHYTTLALSEIDGFKTKIDSTTNPHHSFIMDSGEALIPSTHIIFIFLISISVTCPSAEGPAAM